MSSQAVLTQSPIAFSALKAINAPYEAAMLAAAARVIQSGWSILGPELATFETAFAEYCGVAHCVGVGNGLEAIILLLRAMNIGPGDVVIVPSHTYIATWLAVSAVGATLVPVEVNLHTMVLEAEAIAAAITPETKAILLVHLYGMPCHVPSIQAIAGKIPVISDSAQSHGARVRTPDGQWVRTSALEYASAFSFYPTKNLGALGDGGAITTNDPHLASRLRTLRNYGSEKKYHNSEKGTNSRLDEIQAAMLAVKLPHLDADNAKRRQLAKQYHTCLGEALPREGYPVQLPDQPDWAESVWHLYVVQVPAAWREPLMQYLQAAGIQTLIHYPIAPHQQQAYTNLGYAPTRFPVAQQLASTVLSLPLDPSLSASDITRVCEVFLQGCKTLSKSHPL